MTTATQPAWFFKATAFFAVSFALCWVTPRLYSDIPDFPPISTDRQQVQILDRYFQLPTPAIALAGSSLAFRLKEEYFERQDIRNIALPGESPLTDLTVLAETAWKRPPVVAVETNIMSRRVDQDLVREFRDVARPIPALRPLRTLAALYQRRMDHPAPSFRRADILRAPPAQSLGNAKIIAQATTEYSRSSYDDVIRKNAVALKALVERLEAEGVKVYLFELPVMPVIDQTRYVRTVRLAVSEIMGPDRQLQLNYAAAELRWDDGVHLDERSAVIIAGALERALTSKQKSQTASTPVSTPAVLDPAVDPR